MNKLKKNKSEKKITAKSLQLVTNLETVNCEHLQSGGINIYDSNHSSIFILQKSIPLLLEWLQNVDYINFKESLKDD